MGKALHMLHSVSQIETHRDRLAAADLVVYDIAMDVASLRSRIGDAPILAASFSSHMLTMAVPTNAFWNEFRAGFDGYGTDPRFGFFYFDATAPWKYRKLNPEYGWPEFRPNLQLAEIYAEMINKRLERANANRDGKILYLDDGYREYPERFVQAFGGPQYDPISNKVGDEKLRQRWRAYIETLTFHLYRLGVQTIANCAGRPSRWPHAFTVEFPGTSPRTAMDTFYASEHESILEPQFNVAWFYDPPLEIEGLCLAGEHL